MTQSQPEHCCSATLIITGVELDPEEVSHHLGLPAHRFWKKGDRKSFERPGHPPLLFDSLNADAGWKRFLPDELKDASHADQWGYWLQFLRRHVDAVQKIQAAGATVILSLYVSTSECTSLTPDDFRLLAQCGVQVEWTFLP